MNMMTTASFLMFATRRKLATSDCDLFVLLVCGVILLIVIAICAAHESAKRERHRAIQAQIDMHHALYFKDWHNSVVKSGVVAPVACDLILGKGEECLWVEKHVTLYEVRAVRHSVHTFGSVPLGNSGVRVGSGRSTSESTDEWRPISEGQLYVTNKQVYFDGDKFDRKIPVGKIATIKADWSAVEISSDTRMKSMVFAGVNGNVVKEIVLCVTGQDVFNHLLT